MFLVNGSVKTEGSDNFLPIDSLYNFKRYATRFLLQSPDEVYKKNSEGKLIKVKDIIEDRSPFNNIIKYNNIEFTDPQKKDDSDPTQKLNFKFGSRSYRLNGKDSFFESVSNNIITIGQIFTISIWFNSGIYSLSNGHGRCFFCLGDNTNNIYISLENGSGNPTEYPSVFIDNKLVILNRAYPCMDNEWHNIILCRDGKDQLYFFIDGVIVNAPVINTTSVGGSLLSSLCVGKFVNNSGYFEGLIDEFYLLNGLCEHDSNFNPNNIEYMVPLECEETYSGMVSHVKCNDWVRKYDLLYYNTESRLFEIADPSNLKKMPIRAIALEDAVPNERIKVLTYGTIVSNNNDFPVEENNFKSILPILSSASTSTYNGFSISATSGDPWLMFNGLKKDQAQLGNTKINYWLPSNPQNGKHNWLKIRLNEPKKLKYYTIKSSNSANTTGPTTWKLKGSNDLKQWTLLDCRSFESFNDFENKKYQITNDNDISYKFYEFFDMSFTSISQIHLYDDNMIELLPDFENDFIYISSNSTYNIGEEPWRVADNDSSTYWSPGIISQLYGDVIFDFGYIYDSNIFNYVNVSAYTITCDNIVNGKRIYVPFDFEFLGSDNGIDWDVLHSLSISSATQSPWSNYGDRVKFALPGGETHYRYYKFNIKSSGLILTGGTPNQLRITSIELLDSNDNNIIPIAYSHKIQFYKSILGNIYTTHSTGNITSNLGNLFKQTASSLKTDNFILDTKATNAANSWIKIDFDKTPKEVNSYSITGFSDTSVLNYTNYNPYQFYLQGSDDDSIWTNLEATTAKNVTFTANQKRTYTLTTNIKAYQYYRLLIVRNNSGTILGFKNLQLYDIDNNPLIPESYGANTIPIIGEPVFHREPARINITAPDNGDGLNYHKPQVLLSDFWEFNFTNSDYYNWLTAPDQYDAEIIIDLPIKEFEMFDRTVNGYYFRTMINQSNPESYTFPKSWTLEGFDYITNSWIILDKQDNFKATNNNQLCYFELNQDYNTLSKVAFKITDTDGTSKVIPPNYLGLREFYLSYNKQRIDIPQFDISSNSRSLNRFACYNDNGSYEIEFSSQNLINTCDKCLNREDSISWTLISNEYTHSQLINDNLANGSIHIGLNSPKKIFAYGIYLSQLSMTGHEYPVKHWKFWGSIDNITWDLLDVVNPITDEMVIRSWPLIFTVDCQKAYRYFKFDNINGGTLQGIELYENGSISNVNKITPSAANQGGISSEENLSLYNSGKIDYYIQNLGYTGLTFATAEEEYSVKFFDFNSQIEKVDHSLGDVNIIRNTTIGHSILDGPMVNYYCDSLRINNTCTLTPNNRCRGMRIIVRGDCIIDGTISMTGFGSSYSPLWQTDFPIMDDYGKILAYVPRYGAEGGKIYATQSNRLTNSWSSTTHTDANLNCGQYGVNGKDAVGRGTAGGGSGCSMRQGRVGQFIDRPGNGSRGSCFSGGAGGGSQYTSAAYTTITPAEVFRRSAGPAINEGGIGGTSIQDAALQYNTSGSGNTTVNTNYGGSGAVTGSSFYTTNVAVGMSTGTATTSSGAGGLLILIVYGNLYINLTGKIEACGSRSPRGGFLSGGCSGGGSINIFYGGLFVNNGIITAAGGTSSTSLTLSSTYIPSGNGGMGSVTIDRLF